MRATLVTIVATSSVHKQSHSYFHSSWECCKKQKQSRGLTQNNNHSLSLTHASLSLSLSPSLVLLLHINMYHSGADRYYLGHITLGTAKLLCVLLCCIIPMTPTLYIYCFAHDETLQRSFTMAIASSGCLCCASVIWWVCDWILIASGAVSDGNNIELYHDL
jgi:hypothetical protein